MSTLKYGNVSIRPYFRSFFNTIRATTALFQRVNLIEKQHFSNDILSGGLENDVINGGNGDDSIYGGNEMDVIDGRSGSDTMIFKDDGDPSAKESTSTSNLVL
ncbi:Hypothetical predicted protein, partial [Paramuricea clavata]